MRAALSHGAPQRRTVGRPNFVELHHSVVHKTLKYFLDALLNDSLELWRTFLELLELWTKFVSVK